MEKMPAGAENVVEVTVRHLEGEGAEVAEEERIFTAEEVYALVEKYDGLSRGDFASIEHVVNGKGILVQIEIRVKDEVAKAKFKHPTSYSYRIRTVSSGEFETTIEHIEYDEKGEVDWATSEKYKDGTWK